ncbi:MAG TPA: chromosomal replication initiator protein DnaA [Candidatus Eisenbacteria bacterium]|jgi:chromosomal replication initiator protein
MAVLPVAPEQVAVVWEQVLLKVKDHLASPQAFDTWFRPIVARELTPQQVDLEVPNAFFVDWIHEHHLTTLRRALADILGRCPDLRFSPREPVPVPPLVPARTPTAARPTPAPALEWLDSQLHPRLTFESFVVGASNRFTHAAAMAVSQRPGEDYNPLFIYGDSGLGKTHILHAVGHEVKRLKPEARVYYVSAERFTNEMIWAIQHGQTAAFRNKYRTVDVLLVDDVQFLAGKEGTQEEFFHTFNTLRDAHKQIVVTADKPPKDIAGLEDRLISRFNQGLVADTQQPDLETRIAILRSRCEQESGGLRLADDVVLLIADRVRGNVRDLEGCLVRLMAVASLTHRDVTPELANEVLAQYVKPELESHTPERILAAVSERFGVRPETLAGKRRTQTIALPRQVAMYLMRHLTELSLVEIGRVFGGRDHSTVIHACRHVAERIQSDEAFRDKVNGLFSTVAS